VAATTVILATGYAPRLGDSAEYLARYEEWIIEDLGMTTEGFAASYSVPIRIGLDGGRAF